ncbi:hypothetical protein [Bifidobacterium aemilianum]|nr:hypothetical protein [Bifidobacterium aemilianum]
MSSNHVRIGLLGCIRSEIIKLVSLASTWWLMGLTVLLPPVLTALSVFVMKMTISLDSPSDMVKGQPTSLDWANIWTLIGGTATTVDLVVGIFGIMAITSEFSTGAIVSSLVVNPKCSLFMHAKGLSLFIFSYLAALLGLLCSWLVALVMVSGQKVTALPDSKAYGPWVIVLGVPLILAVLSLLALGLGAICRSTSGGICAYLGIFMFLSTVVGIISTISKQAKWVNSVTVCLPDSALVSFAGAGIQESGGGGSGSEGLFNPAWWQSGLILLAWAAFFYLLGLLVFKRRDIS